MDIKPNFGNALISTSSASLTQALKDPAIIVEGPVIPGTPKNGGNTSQRAVNGQLAVHSTRSVRGRQPGVLLFNSLHVLINHLCRQQWRQWTSLTAAKHYNAELEWRLGR